MRVLVTGAGGQVGRALLRSVPAGVTAHGVAHGELDICDAAAVEAWVRDRRPDMVVNAAAYTAVDRAEAEPALAYAVNADGPRNLATALRASRARLVQISTDFVFDGSASVPYLPDAPTHPLSVYGATKRSGEESVWQILGERGIVLRTAWVYDSQGSNFVRTMLRLMRASGHVRVVADQIGTPTAAQSVAEAVWHLIMRPQLRGTHHWTDAGVASWYDFAVAIAEEAAQVGLLPAGVTVSPIRSEEYPTRARRPSYSVLDKRSLESLGLVPVHWRARLRAVIGEIARA